MPALTSHPNQKILTPRGACERYQFSRRTLTNLIKSGKISAIKVGGRMLRFDADKLDEELARFTKKAVTTE